MEYQRTESAIAKNVAYKRGLVGMLLKRGAENEQRERENEKWEQSLTWTLAL